MGVIIINVLSLFDGMSCGQIALERSGIKVESYYASEIDKYAIKVSQKNCPDIFRLGDVTKWRDWDLPKIELIMGGSPCQGFSFAGKGLNFEDPRSKLFFEFVEILNHYKPKYFLLENVKMKKEHQNVISSYLGVEPIEINSSLVSAQNRIRLYWTNIPNIEQPEDKHIFLKDIIHEGTDQYIKISKNGSVKKKQEKASCLTGGAHSGGNHSDMDLLKFRGGAIRGRYDENGKVVQQLEVRSDFKTNSLTTVQKDNVLTYDMEYTRRYTPIECERLQTLPDNYTEGVSNSQRYKMLGNGWTVDVISHILSYIK